MFLVEAPKVGTGTGGLGNNGTDGDCPNYSSVKMGQNTEKSPGDVRRLAIYHSNSSERPLANADVKNSNE